MAIWEGGRSLLVDTSVGPFTTVIGLTFFKEFSVPVILWLTMEGNTGKDNKIVIVNLLFCGLLIKCFFGYYEDDLLWITLKGILKWLFLHTHGSDILDLKISGKVAVSRLALFIVNKNETFPFFHTY